MLDPACGSGGMFVQSARVVERHHENPAEKLTFYGLEKNATTIRLAKMNLAVHGLEGDIQRAMSYYEDPHELPGKAGYVMANPRVGSSKDTSRRAKTARETCDRSRPLDMLTINQRRDSTCYQWYLMLAATDRLIR